MDSLLFTFNKQQLSQEIRTSKHHENKLTDFLISYTENREMKFRAFRSKKLKRYEQYLEDVQLDECSFSPVKNDESKQLTKLFDDESRTKTIKPRSSKLIESGLKPKVSRNSRQFPSDFNGRSKEKPKSMQLIRQEHERDDQNSFKKKMRQQIQTAIKKRISTSKDTPKIQFPCSDKKLPQVFRLRSISHDNVVSPNSRKVQNNTISIEQAYEKPPSRNGRLRQQTYLNFIRSPTNTISAEPNKVYTVPRRRKIESFYLNAEETPQFKQTID